MEGNGKGGCCDWRRRHADALAFPRGGFEESLALLLRGWEAYAASHRESCGSAIGDDYVLGPEWGRIGRALLGLLNGESGRLDGGTLDGWIRARLAEHGSEEADD